MSPELDTLLFRAKVGGKMHVVQRASADAHASATVRLIERRLKDALAGSGGYLLGMPNLLPDGMPYKARRVLSVGKFGASEFLPRDGRRVLVLHEGGTLAWASRVEAMPGDPPPAVQAFAPPVEDEEILARWFEPFVRTVQESLEVHLSRMHERGAVYDAVQNLSARIADVVGFRFQR